MLVDYDDVIRELKRRGKKLTPQRLEIIKIIFNLSKEHPSLKTILNTVKKELPTTSVSTIYNTIMELEKIGLIRTFEFDKEIRVELNTKPHINIINSKGEIHDVEDDELVDIIADRLKLKSKKFLINILLQN